MPEIARLNLALVGNPNTGKSTLFNGLTGLAQRTGNFPGCTVEKKVGSFTVEGRRIDIIDLPGTYSLASISPDELVVEDVLLNIQPGAAPIDGILVVADGTSLYRNLYLVSQLMELSLPMVLALNMVDLAEDRGLQCDVAALQAKLGFPVVATVASRPGGLNDLRRAILDLSEGHRSHGSLDLFPEFHREARLLAQALSPQRADVLAPQVFRAIIDENGCAEKRLAVEFGPPFVEKLALAQARLEQQFGKLIDHEARTRYTWVRQTLQDVLVLPASEREMRSDRLDRILTHKYFGLPLLVLVLAIIFQAIYSWAGPLMDGIEAVVGAAGQGAGNLLPDGMLKSLVVDGIFAGVGAVLVFLPQIILLFLFIAILEDCGYMARAAFLMDRIFRKCGLSGKSLIPMMSSFACAIPGLMATRTIENKRDRFATILVAPLMSCSARLPVYVVMIAAFIPEKRLLGIINLQGLTLLCMYLLGVVFAVPTAWLLKKTLLRGQAPPFIMELPSYKLPAVGTVGIRVYGSARAFLVRAGTVILCVSIVVWALAYFPHPASIATQHAELRAQASTTLTVRQAILLAGYRPDLFQPDMKEAELEAALLQTPEVKHALAELERRQEAGTPGQAEERELIELEPDRPSRLAAALLEARAEHALTLVKLNRAENGAYLRQSVLGRLGHVVGPLVGPLGWDWRIGMAVIAAFPAREIVIATLGVIFNLGGDQDESSTELKVTLRAAVRPDGRPLFNVPVALSLMVFFALCAQCAATLATIRQETGSWAWPALNFGYMTGLAYRSAMVTFHGANALGWG